MLRTTEIDIGDHVQCDFCSADFTDSDEQGGFLFGTYGTCPRCAPRMLETIKRTKEEHFIVAYAEPGETFKAFTLRMRGGNNKVIFRSLDP